MSIFKDADKAKLAEGFKKRFQNAGLLAFICTYDTDVLLAKLRAAESEISDRLRLFLEPTQVFCSDDDNAAAIAALPAETPHVEDPGYDYNPDLFQGNTGGYLVARQRPIIAVQSYRFVYSNPQLSYFNVPASWIRLDKKYGHVRLLPNSDVSMLPLNAYLLTIFGGGRTIPNFIRLQYTAGIQNIQTEYPALYEFIFRVCALNLIEDTFPGGSQSISVDGLSESQAFDLSIWRDSSKGIVTNEYRVWQDKFSGVRMIVA